MQPALTITPPAWLTAELRILAGLLDDARFVGGPVRDTLLGRPVADLDMATRLIPPEVMARLAAAGIRTIPTGLAHGTVTAMTEGGPIEITTLRRDVETDGRHAVVAFTQDWAADAARRDFTMNALYLDAEARIYDPVGGLDDCRAGRVRFVGDPQARVAEDRLRILRFYRFHAHYGRGAADDAARAACREGARHLASLAGERIRHEMLRLLQAPDPVPVLIMMAEDGVWPAIGLGDGQRDLTSLSRLIRLEADAGADALRRLASLLRSGLVAAWDVARAWRLSNEDRDRLGAMVDSSIDLDAGDADGRRAIWRLGKSAYRDGVLLAAAEQDRPADAGRLMALCQAWDMPALPIRGADLLALGAQPGPGLGTLLRDIEAWWLAHDFVPDREDCLTEARRRLE